MRYDGKPLASHSNCHWKVRVWTGPNRVSPWSEPQTFRTGELQEGHRTARYPLEMTPSEPVELVTHESGTVFADFGRAAFGTIEVELLSPEARSVEVRLGEVLARPYAIERNPGGSRRFRTFPLALQAGRHTYRLAIPPDRRNTGTAAILMPPETGEVMPFRYLRDRRCSGPRRCAATSARSR